MSSLSLKKPDYVSCEEWTSLQKLNKEKEVIGIYLSAHPLDPFEFDIQYLCDTNLTELRDLTPLKGRDITFAGIVTGILQKTTKNGKPYGVLTIEDFTDTYRLTLFSNDFVDNNKYFHEGYALFIKAKVQPSLYADKKDTLELKVTSIDLLSNAREKMIRNVLLKVKLFIRRFNSGYKRTC